MVIICSSYSFGQGKWTHYTQKVGLASDWIKDCLEDKQGNMWFGTHKGLNKFDGVKFETFTKNDGLPANSIVGLLEDKEGTIWIGTAKGICKYDGNKIIPLKDDNSSDYFFVKSLVKHNEDIWIGGYIKKGPGFIVKNYDGHSLNTLTQLGGDNCPVIQTFFFDSHGNIWTVSLGRDDFISRFDGKNWRSFDENDGLPSDKQKRFVNLAMEDSKGNLWLGASFDNKFGGLMKFDGTNWKTYTEDDGFIGKSIRKIVEDDAGNIWVGTNNGLNVFEGSFWTNYTEKDKLPSNIINTTIVDSKGRVWIGTAKGLVLYDKGKWSQFNNQNGLAHNNVRVIKEDSRGNIWVGAASNAQRGKGGISVFADNKLISFESDNLPDFYPAEIFEDSNGHIWISTIGEGVFKYEL